MIYWEVCKKYGINISNNWYDHQVESVVENAEVKIIWDLKKHTDNILGTTF